MLVQVLFETEQQTEQLDLINVNRNIQISTHRYNKTISRAVEIVIRKCFLTSNIYTLRLLHRHINVKTKLCNFMVFGSSRPPLGPLLPALFGLPQDSVLVLCYIIPVQQISYLGCISGALHQLSAYDEQTVGQTQAATATHWMQQLLVSRMCLTPSSNRLLLNPSKTQCNWLGSCRQLLGTDLSQLAQNFPEITSLKVIP